MSTSFLIADLHFAPSQEQPEIEFKLGSCSFYGTPVHSSLRTLECLGSDVRTPHAVLENLAQHPNDDVRASVAENRNTPSYILWTLARDSDPNVRFQLAENPNLPVDLIKTLADDDNPYVACRAQRTLVRLIGS